MLEITWQRWTQNESCWKRTHLKGKLNQQLPPCHRLQCAATKERLRGKYERVLSAPWPGTSSVGTKVLGSPCAHTPLPQSGCSCRSEIKFKLCHASAQANGSFVSKTTWCCKWRQTQTTGKVPTVKWNSNFFTRSSRNTPASPEVTRQTFSLHWCRRGQIFSASLVLCLSVQSPAPL